MSTTETLVNELYGLRTQFDTTTADRKVILLDKLQKTLPHTKKEVKLLYDTLHFLIAYPDKAVVKQKAEGCLSALKLYITNHDAFQYSLFNTGVSGAYLCAAYSFDVVKWLRATYAYDVTLDSMEADDHTLSSILSAVMPKIESEIFQDENAHWKEWLHKYAIAGEDLLDCLLNVFSYSDLRPEIKDELWGALGINITIYLGNKEMLPAELVTPYYHSKLIKTQKVTDKPQQIKLTKEQAEKIIEVSRMVLIRNLREIDPISFSLPELVTYYKLGRGISVALFGMRPERRHPIDSYMGYVAFKNGMPVAYAGSWVLFDSARIGLNVFPSYRGGESRYIFEEVMNLHKQVYHLKRFSVDPYQIGKHNKDGIHSGAFWLYHHLGYRPIEQEQKLLAEAESLKISAQKGYRSSESVLKKLANSRMALVMDKKAVDFDAVDLSMAYAAYVKKKFKGNRLLAEQKSLAALQKLTGLKTDVNATALYVMRNWAVVLMHKPASLNKSLAKEIKQMLELKIKGGEEVYMKALRQSSGLRLLVQRFIELYKS
ncbi:MAG: hypothetical protein U0V74_17315 [Chitinophagales bacterium]